MKNIVLFLGAAFGTFSAIIFLFLGPSFAQTDFGELLKDIKKVYQKHSNGKENLNADTDIWKFKKQKDFQSKIKNKSNLETGAIVLASKKAWENKVSFKNVKEFPKNWGLASKGYEFTTDMPVTIYEDVIRNIKIGDIPCGTMVTLREPIKKIFVPNSNKEIYQIKYVAEIEVNKDKIY